MKNPLLAAFAIGVSMTACASVPVEVMGGDTNCYTLFVLQADVGENTFSASGFKVDASILCPKIVSTKVVVFTDKNGNGLYDAGDVLHSTAFGNADPPSTTITTGSMAGGKNSNRGGTNWLVTITNENGGTTSHGGTF